VSHSAAFLAGIEAPRIDERTATPVRRGAIRWGASFANARSKRRDHGRSRAAMATRRERAWRHVGKAPARNASPWGLGERFSSAFVGLRLRRNDAPPLAGAPQLNAAMHRRNWTPGRLDAPFGSAPARNARA
jgi:hypothetical protein